MRLMNCYEPLNARLARDLNLRSLFAGDLYANAYDCCPELDRRADENWCPAVDIKEEEDRFVIYADLPGVDPKQIEITMDQGVLTLKGCRSDEKKEESEGYKRVERITGSFYRCFNLPDTADADRIEARGKDGVLEITLPKQEKVQPRRVSVQS